MNKVTIEEFKNLLRSKKWKREQFFETIDRSYTEKTTLEGEIEIESIIGYAYKRSTLDNIIITYNEAFSYDQYEPDSLKTDRFVERLEDNRNKKWSINTLIVDEKGDKLSVEKLYEYLDEADKKLNYLNDFSTIDYDELDIEKTIYIDIDDEEEETITITSNYQPTLSFAGSLLAETHISCRDISLSSNEKILNFFLYKTKKDKFICLKEYISLSEDDESLGSTKICKTLEEVKYFFGNSELAKDLYKIYKKKVLTTTTKLLY